MPKICQITKKKSMLGQNRSHAMNATKRKFSLNIQYHSFWLPNKKKKIKIRISSKGLRMINKFGIEKIYKKYII
ncbi:50S ribosomal protein L28 [Buchnera aphidicola (Cinara kochiana kochiana)]|uniref:Large ribosomal subunit protein bL28 n=1 Tax=Buchnera aphidicola (Cinara kochiana kochiana) TaxID=2518976 RepID=A0A451D5B0_9GAMM|nr:50S ribosomal protein L28 [Buchnera aphidicola]VFP80977.1 50S ribosomal protein L28 [Buchnera aphidicola (Cinara kochiana kochiana)]